MSALDEFPRAYKKPSRRRRRRTRTTMHQACRALADQCCSEASWWATGGTAGRTFAPILVQKTTRQLTLCRSERLFEVDSTPAEVIEKRSGRTIPSTYTHTQTTPHHTHACTCMRSHTRTRGRARGRARAHARVHAHRCKNVPIPRVSDFRVHVSDDVLSWVGRFELGGVPDKVILLAAAALANVASDLARDWNSPLQRRWIPMQCVSTCGLLERDERVPCGRIE